LHSLGKKYNKSSKHSTIKISFKHSSRTIGEEWVENNIQWKIGSDGELLCQNLIRRADSVSLHIWRTVNVYTYWSYFSLLLLNTLTV